MKKIVAIVALLSCAVSTAYGVAFITPSTAGTVSLGGTVGPVVDLKPSANVAVAYESSTSTGVAYTIGSFHCQGNRAYGTSSVDTNIFYIDFSATPGIVPASSSLNISGVTFPSTVANNIPSTFFSTGWTASK